MFIKELHSVCTFDPSKEVAIAKKIYNEYYLKGNLKHKLVGKKDYITFPKKDGYRSLHLVYEFKSDKGKKDYNGLKAEVQIRSSERLGRKRSSSILQQM